VKAGVGEYDFPDIPRRRVALKNDLDVFFKSGQHKKRR
jgi:hypothetical protein